MPIITSRANAASIGYGGTRNLPYMWVIGGNEGRLWTSTSSTASSWTSRTSSFDTTGISHIASNSKMFVAVGDNGKLATSTNGIDWTQRTSSFGTTNINNVAYGADGYWVAVGNDGKLATSTNGVDWTQRTSGTANSLYCAAYGNGLWLVGEQGNNFLRRATDPTGTWTATSCTLTSAPLYNSIYYWKEQSIWVLGCDGGTTGALASSTNGTTWTSRTSAFSASSLGGGFISNSSVLVFGNTKDILGPTMDFQTSTNGTTWTDRTPSDTSSSVFQGAVDDTGFMVFCGNEAGSAGIRLQSSSDGTTWTNRTSPSTTANVFGYTICHSYGLPTIK